MARIPDPRAPRAPHLRLLPAGLPPLPVVVPLLRPDQPVTPADDALLTSLARRARGGDLAARDLLWTAFAPRLEPAILRCARVTWGSAWVRRNGRPWDLEDMRQEAWRVFAELTAGWNGEGSVVPYVTAYFPWRLRNAMRRLGPPRRAVPLRIAAEPVSEYLTPRDVEASELLTRLAAALDPTDAEVLRLRRQGARFGEIAGSLGVSRRTVSRRWARIRRVAREVLGEL